ASAHCAQFRTSPAGPIRRRRAGPPPRRAARSRTDSRRKDTHGVIGARAAAALLLCTLATGCGTTSQPAGTSSAETTTGAATRTVEVYFLRGNALVPVRVPVTDTPAIATASPQTLPPGAPDGYRP